MGSEDRGLRSVDTGTVRRFGVAHRVPIFRQGNKGDFQSNQNLRRKVQEAVKDMDSPRGGRAEPLRRGSGIEKRKSPHQLEM
jgi:hypothetical protein